MATLYITEQGARLEKEYWRFLVTKENQVLTAVPAGRLDHVVLVGQVGVTTPALLTLLDAGVGMSLVSRTGELRGRLSPPTGMNLRLRHKQYERATDPAFCLAIGRQIVGGKLRNYRALARRWARTRPEVPRERIERIDTAVRQAATAPDLNALRGIEGEGTRHYFAVWRRTLKPGLGFDKRTRRPPRDPVNALLSLGYTLLTDNLITACEVVGLDPYDGFFHADKYGRPALALDLMEEFRPLIVDAVVLNIINRRMLTAADFEPGPEGGVYLKREALRTFFQQYSARLNTTVIHPYFRRSMTYQRCFEEQARWLRQVIEGEREEYQPFLTK